MYELSLERNSSANVVVGPFELTKLSAQVSVLMANGNASSINATSMSDPANARATRAVAASYQNKGTFKTAKNIIKHRGFLGLYSGFSLHLRKFKFLLVDQLVGYSLSPHSVVLQEIAKLNDYALLKAAW